MISIEAEKQYISETAISEDEKNSSYKMLSALSGAVKKGDEDLIDALICGYNYFILFNKCVSDNVASLIEMLAQFEQIL